ncbi:hypothetical protein L584_13450 [Pantoea agglomerans Tx10]|nr:hypothetical protein L584_13450 [Pantoea agglomerans Tx10]
MKSISFYIYFRKSRLFILINDKKSPHIVEALKLLLNH